ncbi:hypothetical protein [Dongia sp.]|uniref:hypothetical protein n=1 Tax=Dongia sp. TaxID=1977262 RepID=UPI0035B01CC3
MGMVLDFMSDPRVTRCSAGPALSASLTVLPPAPRRSPFLRFADFFIDGCDVRLFQGVDCHTQAALPDGSLVDLGGIFRGRQRPADFGFEYGA